MFCAKASFERLALHVWIVPFSLGLALVVDG